MQNLFAADGPIISFLTKVGQLIILTVIWFLCCIPIVTFASSGSAFYYSVIKSVRREVGYPVREFFNSFKRTIKRGGIIVSLIIELWFIVLYVNYNFIANMEEGKHFILYIGTIVIVALSACMVIYLLPVMSRFDVSIPRWFKMSVHLMLARLPYTIVLFVSIALLAWAAVFWVSAVLILFIPGMWCYLATFLIEPALKRYMPKPEEGQQKEWYDE